MIKTKLQSALTTSSEALIASINQLSDSQYETPISADKWNPGQHIAHLYLSAKPLVKALSIPKVVLEAKFGTRDREELTYEGLKAKYDSKLSQGGVKAPEQFVQAALSADERTATTENFKNVIRQLIDIMDEWSEEELSKHVIPHPAIGALTMREMLMFTDIHNRHHHKAVADL